MDHTHVKGRALFKILVDIFSGWPEVIKIANRKATSIKQILRTIFLRNGVPKTLVSDNAPEFYAENLCSWQKRIGCFPYKTPSYHSQSNRIAERMVQTLKMRLRVFSPFKNNIEIY